MDINYKKTKMIKGIDHLHSANRYAILVLLLIVIFTSYKKWKSKQEYTNQDDKLNLITFILTHIQLLGGLILYFMGSKVIFNENTMSDRVLRFFAVEHLFGMLIAIALITIVRIKLKKISDPTAKHKKTFVFYLIALLIILISIPWPFYNVGVGEWF